MCTLEGTQLEQVEECYMTPTKNEKNKIWLYEGRIKETLSFSGKPCTGAARTGRDIRTLALQPGF